jgi:hypothetical protein
MPLFKPEAPASLVASRLSDLDAVMSRQIERTIEELNQPGINPRVYQAMKHKTNDLVAFAIEFAMKACLRERELDGVANHIFLVGCAEYYWNRFNDIPEDMGTWNRANVEVRMAGNAFQETCGSTGTQEADDGIRRFGADTFLKVYDMAKKELKAVRIRL